MCAWSIGIPVFCRNANGQVSPRYLRSTSSIFPASSKRVITFMHSEMEFKRITLFALASFFILISFYRGRSHYHRTLVVKHSWWGVEVSNPLVPRFYILIALFPTLCNQAPQIWLSFQPAIPSFREVTLISSLPVFPGCHPRFQSTGV